MRVARLAPENAEHYGWWPIFDAAFSSDGTLVLTAQKQGGVTIWDAGTGQKISTCCDHEGWDPSTAIFRGDTNDQVIVTYADGTAVLWDLSDIRAGVERHTWGKEILSLAVNRDGSRLVTVTRQDGKASVWDMSTFQKLMTWQMGLVSSVDFSADGDKVVAAGLDGVIRVWKLDTKQPMQPMELPDNAGVTAAIFGGSGGRRDQSWIIAGDAAGTTTIWDAETGQLLGKLHMHSEAVNTLDMADDGRILSASDDATAKIYKCDTCGAMDGVVMRARAQYKIDPVETEPSAMPAAAESAPSPSANGAGQRAPAHGHPIPTLGLIALASLGVLLVGVWASDRRRTRGL